MENGRSLILSRGGGEARDSLYEKDGDVCTRMGEGACVWERERERESEAIASRSISDTEGILIVFLSFSVLVVVVVVVSAVVVSAVFFVYSVVAFVNTIIITLLEI